MKPDPSRFAAILATALVAICVLAGSAQAENEIVYSCDLDVCLLDPANPGSVTNLTFNGATSFA